MFAIVRTGGKQYRVAPGDKIVVEKLAGEAGDSVDLTDVLLAGDGGDLKSTSGLTVAARIVAQAKGEKVTVFKKRRRHNYRRKKGHRQQHTILEIVSVGGQKAEKKTAAKAETAPKSEPAKAPKAQAAPAHAATDAPVETKAAKSPKPAAKKAEASTSDAAPAKAPAKKATAKPAAKTEKK
ncbi:50S ribosomal protein L21 [Sphingomonas mesophila]|uniref:50S ribosomal protein L21 n=1 Tax=Sphingomonas mesophila TaxID=2303576 RepID=UPI000E58FB22|nr:50S ribosomal protein L21 [Sphingomonas mesophila]